MRVSPINDFSAGPIQQQSWGAQVELKSRDPNLPHLLGAGMLRRSIASETVIYPPISLRSPSIQPLTMMGLVPSPALAPYRRIQPFISLSLSNVPILTTLATMERVLKRANQSRNRRLRLGRSEVVRYESRPALVRRPIHHDESHQANSPSNSTDVPTLPGAFRYVPPLPISFAPTAERHRSTRPMSSRLQPSPTIHEFDACHPYIPTNYRHHRHHDVST
jgi:hypothetical protein